MIGHSIGEYFGGLPLRGFSLEDGLALVAERSRLMQEFAGRIDGGHFPWPKHDVAALLDDELGVAVINEFTSCVVSVPLPAVEKLEARLSDWGSLTAVFVLLTRFTPG
jgi:acyl transferase domain-containing protein